MNEYVFILWGKYSVGTITPVNSGKSALMEMKPLSPKRHSHQETHSDYSVRCETVKTHLCLQDLIKVILQLYCWENLATMQLHTLPENFHTTPTNPKRPTLVLVDTNASADCIESEQDYMHPIAAWNGWKHNLMPSCMHWHSIKSFFFFKSPFITDLIWEKCKHVITCALLKQREVLVDWLTDQREKENEKKWKGGLFFQQCGFGIREYLWHLSIT